MKVLFAGGGSAGHINPAISIAQYIKYMLPDSDLRFVGNKDSLESKLVAREGFKFYEVSVDRLYRKITLKNLKSAVKVFTSTEAAKRIIADFQPDIVIGTGGYVSFPVVRAATLLGVPAAVHEQNAYPGVANRKLAKYVDRVLLGLELDGEYFSENIKTTFVGNPIRLDFATVDKESARKKLGIPRDVFYVVSFAGSLGASRFNEAIAELIARYHGDCGIKFTHAAGRLGYGDMKEALSAKGADKNVDVREYIDDMQNVMAAADLVIGRAGANTLAEITALGKPTILIPSPNVTHNHQYHNACSLINRNAALMIEEKDLTPGFACGYGGKGQKITRTGAHAGGKRKEGGCNGFCAQDF